MRGWPRRLSGGRSGLAVVALLAAWMTVVRVPAALAFPYSARVGGTTLLSEQPIGPAIARVLGRADRLEAASPLARPDLGRQVVLTDGGWRWRLLAAHDGDVEVLFR